MNKKVIISICIVCSVILLGCAGFFWYKMDKNTKEARAAAEEFAAMLREGDLESLELKYYAYSETDNTLVADDNGVAQVRIVTKQQLADKYGVEVMKAMNDTDEGQSEAGLLESIMAHSIIQTSVGTTLGDTATMQIAMQIPDIKSWIKGLSMEDLEQLAGLKEGHLEDLEARMESGEIASQVVRFPIPMLKQNGKWRFQVTEEMEKVFFGGLYNLFDPEETTAE